MMKEGKEIEWPNCNSSINWKLNMPKLSYLDSGETYFNTLKSYETAFLVTVLKLSELPS